MGLHWDDSEDIAMELIELHPNKDPLSLRFTDLRDMVTNLPDFADDPGKSNESLLERIQMAWYEEWGADEG
jgi:FeS assembly protein IscX